MDKVQRYLDIVPLLLVAMAGTVVSLVIPARYRMPIALSLTVIWLPLGEMADLGLIPAIAPSYQKDRALNGGIVKPKFLEPGVMGRNRKVFTPQAKVRCLKRLSPYLKQMGYVH